MAMEWRILYSNPQHKRLPYCKVVPSRNSAGKALVIALINNCIRDAAISPACARDLGCLVPNTYLPVGPLKGIGLRCHGGVIANPDCIVTKPITAKNITFIFIKIS